MTEPILNLGNGKWAIKESGILGYTSFDGFNDVDNYVADEFVFTRATSSTVINSKGIIEDSCYNRISNSDPSSSVGSTTSSNITYSTFNWGINGLVNSTVFGDSSVSRARYHGPGIVGVLNTMSFFIKMDDNSEPIIGATTAIGDLSFAFDGGIFTGQSFKQYMGNNIWFCYASTVILGGSNANGIIKFNTQSNKGFIASGYQFSIGTLRPYLKTTNRLNVPTVDYTLSGTPMYLLEPQRTNILIRSQEFDNVAWVNFGTSIVTNQIISPDGTLTADLVTSTGLTNDFIYQQPILSTGTTVAGSIFVKNNNSTTSRLYMRSNLTAFEGNINWSGLNLTSVTLVSGTTMSYDTLADNWYRIKYSCTINEANQRFRIQPDRNSNGTSIYIWGAQLEVGPNVTSYIPTTTVTIQRNADIGYIDMQSKGLLNPNNFTFFCEGFLYNGSLTADNIFLSSNPTVSSTDSIGFWYQMQPFYVISGTTYTINNNMANNLTYKIIIQVNGTAVNFFRNGIQIGTTQNIRVFDYRYIVFNGTIVTTTSTYSIKNLKLYDRTLTDSECITLTTL